MGKGSQSVDTPPIYVPQTDEYVSPYDYTPQAPEMWTPPPPDPNQWMQALDTTLLTDISNTPIYQGEVQQGQVYDNSALYDIVTVGSGGLVGPRGQTEREAFDKGNMDNEMKKFSVADTIVTSPLEDTTNQKRLKAILG